MLELPGPDSGLTSYFLSVIPVEFEDWLIMTAASRRIGLRSSFL